MSDDYKIQINPTVNGSLMNIRANSPEELKEILEGLRDNGADIHEALGGYVQHAVSKGVFTGGKPAGGGAQGGGGGGQQNSSGGAPECSHGPMKDLAHKNYQSRWYCPSPNRNDQCKPRK